jgi:hypothetical protein
MKPDSEFTLEVWRLHPRGVRIVPADKHLLGEAARGAVKWCGPFTYANKSGWWVYPPLDIDIVYRPPDGVRAHDPKFDEDPDFQARNMLAGHFDYKVLNSRYRHDEASVIRELTKKRHRFKLDRRELYSFANAEPNVANIWTGCIFKTPPGWCLHIRSPINIDLGQPFRIQEGILETDWMRYDIWMNLKFFRYDEWAHIRREQQYPVAQLVPVRRESYDRTWALKDTVLNRPGPLRGEAEEIFDAWNDYNQRKWEHGVKDPATHHKQRKKAGY